MKLEKLFTFLWSCVLGFAVSFGAVSCMVTAFHMAVKLSTVALWCGVGTVLCSVCYCLPLGPVPIAAVSLISGILWRFGTLDTSIESLLYRLSRQYDRAYDWGILKLNYLTADDMELHLWLILCLLGVVVAMAVSWAVCRRKSSLPGVGLAVVMLGICMVVTDTLPDIPCLYLLLFGIVMLMLTGRVRRQEEERGNRASLLLALPVAIGLLALFALVPQKSYRGAEPTRKLMDDFLSSETMSALFGKVNEVGTTGTSVDSGTVNLTTVGIRLQSQAEVLQVLTDYDGKLYLRGRALDRYDGTSWTDSGVSTKELYWPDSRRLSEGGEVMITTRYAHRMLYLPYYVQSKDMSEVTRGLENVNKLTQYSFSCDALSTENDYYKIYTQAIYDPQEWDLEFARYLHLDDTVWKWAEPLALEIIGQEPTVYGRAQAIREYVRASATYDTNTYRMPASATDFVKWFLEESETGYCVHFASAATVLLQAAGIPARYVTGYTVDAKAAYLNVVRAKDAHAWAEYWLPGYGWMVLEATPPDLREETPEATASATAEPTQPEQPATQTTKPTQSVEQKEPQSPHKAKNMTLLWVLLGSLMTVAGVIGQWQLRVGLRRKRLLSGDTNCQTLSCWHELTRLASLSGQLPDPELFALAQKAKFSQYAITGQEIARLHGALKKTREQLKKRSVFHQIYYCLILALY